jgi:hypothetical protein
MHLNKSWYNPKGYIKIYSTAYSFAALKADGSITVWGDSFVSAFAPPEFESPHALIEPLALRAAKAYAFEDSGGANAPTDKGYIKIYSTAYSFAALKAD